MLARRDFARAHGGDQGGRHPSRSTSSWSTCIRSARRSRARLHVRRGGREHRHRRADDGARRGEEPRRRRGGHRSRRLRRDHRGDGRRTAARSPRATRLALAKKAFAHTAAYDARDRELPHRRSTRRRQARALPRAPDPAVGEGAGAALRREPAPARGVLSRPRARCRAASPRYTQLQGKELSYNNIADADAAWECVKTFERPACVIVKHANPCGVADGADPLTAYRTRVQDRSRRPRSAASSRSTGRSTARPREAVAKQFVEVVIAPEIGRRRARPCSRRSRTCACSPCRWGTRPKPRPQARRRRPAGADARRAERRRGRAEGRDEARADRRRAGGPALRLARREVREVERDRVLRRRDDARRRRRADEPRGQRPHRVDQGAERGTVARPARSSRRTRSSRSATASTWSRRPARRRSSSRAAACATTR